VSWLSKNQPSISLSTPKDEYIFVDSYYNQSIWMKQTLEDLQVKYDHPILLNCHNTSAIKLSKNIVMHQKTKHVQFKFHFLREQVSLKNIKVEYLDIKETVNAIIGMGEEIEESIIVQKVVGSLPMRFNPKISALEEISDLNSISMDKLHGIFTAYEMITEHENPDVKEAAFKASKRSKQKKKEQEEYSSSNDVSEDDEEVANFIKRLNQGTNGRYRGKLPLICFNCDGIGHFSNKFPHKRKRNYKGYSKGRQTYKGKRTTKKVFKKNFCTNEDISSSDEDEVSDNETGRFLFMAVEDSGKEDSEEEYEESYEEEIEEA
jgi:hypothetical protein